MAQRSAWLFGRFRVDPVDRVLLSESRPVAITPKAFSALLVLLERPGRVVSREELTERLWPGAVVTDASLSQCIFQLRRALGPRPDGGRYVVTIPGQGFSLAADVEEEIAGAAAEPRADALPAAPREDAPAAVDAAAQLAARGSAPAPSPAPLPERAPRALSWAVIATVSLAALIVLGWAARGLFARSAPGPPQRPAAAILGFNSLSGDARELWLGTALAEMLTTELAAGGQMRVVPGEVVARTRVSLGIPDAESASPVALDRLRRALAVEKVVLGSYLLVDGAHGSRIRVDVRVLDAPAGEIVGSFSEEGSQGDLFTVVARLGVRIRRVFNVAEPTAAQAEAARAGQPSNPAAIRLFAQGLAALRRFDAQAARDHLEQAAAVDPESALIRLALSQAWTALGHDARAAVEAEAASRWSKQLSRENQLLIEGRRCETIHRFDLASDAYRGLWTFFPDNLEHGLLLAASLTRAGKGQVALDVIAALRRLPAPSGADPRLDIEEAAAAQSLADYDRQRRSASAAVAKGDAAGARLVAAAGLWYEAAALRALGRREDALARLARSRAIYAAAGDRGGVAEAVGQSGLIARELGDLARARRLYGEALSIVRAIGYQQATATLLTNLGVLELYEGNLDQAEQRLGEARTIASAAGNLAALAGALSPTAALHAAAGDPAEARRAAEQLLDIGRRTGNRDNEASGLRVLGGLLIDDGNLEQARTLLEQALAILESLGDRSKTARVQGMLAWIAFRAGEGSAGVATAKAALAQKQALRDRLGAAQILEALVPMLCEGGEVDAARQAAAEHQRLAREVGAALPAASAAHNVGLVELTAGRYDRAQVELEQALAARFALGQAVARETSRLALARLALAAGRPADAIQLARAAAQFAQQRRLRVLHAGARATLAAALHATGQREAAQHESERARALTDQTTDRLLSLQGRIVAASTGAASDLAGDARELQRLGEEAKRLGFHLAALEARCARAVIESALGRRDLARALLAETRAEARARGLAPASAQCGGPETTPPAR